ncbi:VP3 [Kummerowia striata gokushovirus]|nr:VP3 [Kummerowia striata gokushovirus]
MKFQTKHTEKRRVRHEFDPSEKRTKDSFKDETDINKIMAKYLATGQLPHLARQDPRYGDFSDVGTYQEAMDVVLLAREQFDALPAAVRAECLNDPMIFLDKVQDEDWALRHKLALPKTAGSEAEASPPRQPGPKAPADAGATSPSGDASGSTPGRGQSGSKPQSS